MKGKGLNLYYASNERLGRELWWQTRWKVTTRRNYGDLAASSTLSGMMTSFVPLQRGRRKFWRRVQILGASNLELNHIPTPVDFHRPHILPPRRKKEILRTLSCSHEAKQKCPTKKPNFGLKNNKSIKERMLDWKTKKREETYHDER